MSSYAKDALKAARMMITKFGSPVTLIFPGDGLPNPEKRVALTAWARTLGDSDAAQYLEAGQNVSDFRPTRFQFLPETFTIAQLTKPDTLRVEVDGLEYKLRKPVPTKLDGVIIKWRAIGTLTLEGTA